MSDEETVHILWHQITSLAKLPGVDGRPHLLDFCREFLILCLPEHVRQGIAHDSDLPVAELVERAKSLRLCGLTTAAKSSRGIVSTVVHTRPLSVEGDQISSIGDRSRVPAHFQKKKKTRGYLTESGLCNYHDRWGEKARFCVEGCLWKPPKNGLLGRR